MTSHEVKLRKAHALGLLTSQTNKPDHDWFHACAPKRSLRRMTAHKLKLRKVHALGLLTSQTNNKQDQGFHACDTQVVISVPRDIPRIETPQGTRARVHHIPNQQARLRLVPCLDAPRPRGLAVGKNKPTTHNRVDGERPCCWRCCLTKHKLFCSPKLSLSVENNNKGATNIRPSTSKANRDR